MDSVLDRAVVSIVVMTVTAAIGNEVVVDVDRIGRIGENNASRNAERL